MSRTDKTQPIRIRLWDGTLRRVAVHDHRDGVCDLPSTVREDLDHARQHRGAPGDPSCYWAFEYTGTDVCPCYLCRGGLRDERRAARHRNRRELARLMKLARADWRDLD